MKKCFFHFLSVLALSFWYLGANQVQQRDQQVGPRERPLGIKKGLCSSHFSDAFLVV